MWAYETSFYQIYPLGFCGAPFENDGKLEHRILKVLDWIPHLEKLGVGAVLFNRHFIDRFVVSSFYGIVFGVIDQNIAPILINVSVHELFGCNAEVFVDADHAERS